MNGLKIDIDKGKQVAVILFERFNSEEGIFGKNSIYEDLMWGSGLEAIGIKKGSYEYLMFITMVISIDYMRDADRLWAAGRRSMQDPETRWLFNPDSVKGRPIDEITAAMKKHSLSQKHGRDARIWKTVSDSFARFYDSDPRKLIEECNWDAANLYERKYDARFKKDFPSLSGNKIFPLWIRMLHDNLGIELKNMERIPIPTDVHVARATFATGCLTGEFRGSIADAAQKVEEAWKTIIASVSHPKLKNALQMDEALWHLSKNGCTSRKGNICPRRTQCPVGFLCVGGLVQVSAKGVEVRTGN
jgi:hypothetical protein